MPGRRQYDESKNKGRISDELTKKRLSNVTAKGRSTKGIERTVPGDAAPQDRNPAVRLTESDEIRGITINFREAERPFAPESERQRPARVRYNSDDYYGAFSLQTFCDVAGLEHTHEDAWGWQEGLRDVGPGNFWIGDSGVRPWAYYEDYDNWQDTYGMDAVAAVYHSGHGGMDGNGTFYAPVGADWGGLGCTIYSDRMRLGNEQVNYIFWSTCLSLRVLDGNSPVRTWSAANLGFRMLFGFETVSVDDPDYGKNFWDEWNKADKPFSTAWLDASWDIAHDQSPSVVACGATSAEARDRLYNEKYFSFSHVSADWWWWRWYSSSNSIFAIRDRNLLLPQKLQIAHLQPAQMDRRAITGLIETFADVGRPTEVTMTPRAVFWFGDKGQKVALTPDGSSEVQFSQPNLSNRVPLPVEQAFDIARVTLSRYGLDQKVDLVFDRVRLAYEGGGTSGARRGEIGEIEGPYITETTIQFKQLINGVPVVTPGVGDIRISIDNNAVVTCLQDTTRQVDRLLNRPMRSIRAPGGNGPVDQAKAVDIQGYDRVLAEEWTKHLTSWVVRGRMPLSYTVMPGSTEVGYEIRGNIAFIAARRIMEVDFGDGYRKRYWVVAPIFE